MLDYQSLLLDPVYAQFGLPATLTTRGNSTVSLTVRDKTQPTQFTGFGVECNAFTPAARVRMAEILAAGLSPENDVQGGHIEFNGKRWAIKSYEYVPTAAGINDGQLKLLLINDAERAPGNLAFHGAGGLHVTAGIADELGSSVLAGSGLLDVDSSVVP